MTIAQRAAPARPILMLVATLLFGIWIYLIGRQFLPLLMFAVSVSCCAIIMYSIWRWLNEGSLWLTLSVGALVGYFSSIVAVAIVTFTIYGASQFVGRFFPTSLYIYPSVALGWLYGMILVALQKIAGAR